MADTDTNATRASYNRVASDYARRFDDELEHKPLERDMLASFAAEVGDGLICDLGCGPGHVAAYLRGCGAEVVGLDLSDAMVEEARRRHPDVRFDQADMRALPFADGALAGIVALYSLIHIPPDEIPMTLAELRRTLQPDGALLVGFHVGEEMRHLDAWWDQPVSLDFHFFTVERMRGWLTGAGFAPRELTQREPYPEIEAQTRRAYTLATSPGPQPANR